MSQALQQTGLSDAKALPLAPAAERRYVAVAGRSVAYPKTYSPEEAPRSVRVLLDEVLPRMLQGEHPALAVLREQLREVTVTEVELSGVGFFARLVVPPEMPTADPLRIVGGDAELVLSDVEHGAGCVLFVDGGRLSMFEGYTYGGEQWTEGTEVVSIGRVTPIAPANPTLQTDRSAGHSARSRARR